MRVLHVDPERRLGRRARCRSRCSSASSRARGHETLVAAPADAPLARAVGATPASASSTARSRTTPTCVRCRRSAASPALPTSSTSTPRVRTRWRPGSGARRAPHRHATDGLRAARRAVGALPLQPRRRPRDRDLRRRAGGARSTPGVEPTASASSRAASTPAALRRRRRRARALRAEWGARRWRRRSRSSSASSSRRKGHATLDRRGRAAPARTRRSRLVFCGAGSLDDALRRRGADARRARRASPASATTSRVPRGGRRRRAAVAPRRPRRRARSRPWPQDAPVVASRVGGLAEVVVDGETGRLVPPATPPRSARRSRELARDAGAARTHGRCRRSARGALGFRRRDGGGHARLLPGGAHEGAGRRTMKRVSTGAARRARAPVSHGSASSCVGDLMLDRFVWGRVERISPEAPVPVVHVTREDARPGGAGNVVSNVRGARRAGRGRRASSATTRREGGSRAMLAGLGAATTAASIVDRHRPTIEKTRIIAHHQQVVRLDREARRRRRTGGARRVRDHVLARAPTRRRPRAVRLQQGRDRPPSCSTRSPRRTRREPFTWVVDPKRANFAPLPARVAREAEPRGGRRRRRASRSATARRSGARGDAPARALGGRGGAHLARRGGHGALQAAAASSRSSRPSRARCST